MYGCLRAQAQEAPIFRNSPCLGTSPPKKVYIACWSGWSSVISLPGKSQELGIQLRAAVISFICIVPTITDSLTVVDEVSLKKKKSKIRSFRHPDGSPVWTLHCWVRVKSTCGLTVKACRPLLSFVGDLTTFACWPWHMGVRILECSRCKGFLFVHTQNQSLKSI